MTSPSTISPARLLHERSALQAVFFDLDGTLADTAPNLAVALNRLRAEAGLARLPLDSIRPKVSGGTPALLGLAFDAIDLHNEEFQRLRTRFLALYGELVASEDTAGWGADGEAHAPADIEHWLRSWTV